MPISFESKPLLSKLEYLLEELEKKPDIADFFRDIGLKSKGTSFRDCPLATYLTKETGAEVGVTQDSAYYIYSYGSVILGAKARRFALDVWAYNKYPDLVKQ